MPLADKTALITGAGSGIGRALAIEASRRGMKVALVGRRPDMLRLTQGYLVPEAESLILPGDVTSPEIRQALRDEIADRWGQLHVLVNNAGLVLAGPLAQTEDAELDNLMAVNLVAPIAMTREMLPLLRAGSPARVVNLGSMLGDIPFPLFAAYSASKFGLRGLSGALRRELRSFGIGVTYAAPRGALTDATRAIAHFIDPLGMPLDSTDVIARQVWDAVALRRSNAYPHGRERIFALVERLCPALVDHTLTRQLEASGVRRLVEEAMPQAATAAGQRTSQ